MHLPVVAWAADFIAGRDLFRATQVVGISDVFLRVLVIRCAALLLAAGRLQLAWYRRSHSILLAYVNAGK